jgi:SAM-dependent methyltransferase
MAERLRLHLGCGATRLEGWVNCDLFPAPHVDVAFDVQKTWPFGDGTVAHIYASHLLEHLSDPWAFFSEAWRVLHPVGGMVLRLPHGGHRAAWWDLTHVRPWFPESFACLQPGYAEAVGNPQHLGRPIAFGIESVDQRVSGKFARPLRWRPFRRVFCAFAANLADACEELWVRLYALKTPEQIAAYQRTRTAQCVPSRYVIYRHHWERREVQPGETDVLVPLAELEVVNGFHAWHW